MQMNKTRECNVSVDTKMVNYGFMLDEIITIFFSKADINHFQKLVSERKNKSEVANSILPKKEKEQIDLKSDNRHEVYEQIDFLITYGSEKLSADKYLLFIQNLGKYCIVIGELNAAIMLFERIIEASGDENNLYILKADAYLNLTEIYRLKAQWQESFNYVKMATNIYKRNNDTKGLASCFNIIGTIYGEQGKFRKARDYFENSLSLLHNSRDAEFKGMIEINLGIINDKLGNYHEALSYLNQALITYNNNSNFERIAEIRHNIGMLHIKNQNLQTALLEFDRNISTSRKIGYLPTLGISYLSKSYVFTLQNDYNLAEAFADKALEICNQTSDRLSAANVYKIKGIIQSEKKNYAEAEYCFNTSLRINKEYSNKLNEAETFYELGILYKNIGNTIRSKSMFTEALNYFKSLKTEGKIKVIKEQMANLAAA